ncbi:MAG: helix-turn-helix domain-containing protein [Candidatus Rhabdochlamydia sp.]
MKIFSYLKSLIVKNPQENLKEDTPKQDCKETELPKLPDINQIIVPLLTISQAAKKHGVTRQAIFFAIKMKRLNATKENDTWLLSEKDLKEYSKNKYCRSNSRKEGELIFDKSKGYYSITEAAKFLGKNTNHIYYLVRMGTLKSHRQGASIVIQDVELHKYAEFINQKSEKILKLG